MRKRLIAASAVLMISMSVLNAQNNTAAFKDACDSMSVLMKERTSVQGTVKVKKYFLSDKKLNIRFSTELGEYPWRKGDVEWFRKTFASILPEKFKGCTIGNVTVNGTDLESYIVVEPGKDGKPDASKFRRNDPGDDHVFVERLDGQEFSKGMTGRTIALWQSHGRYFEEKLDRWEWQRAPLFQTVEDMYTQTYVLPFLIPMLENAGAYVMTPRERDPQRNEIVADNDASFDEGRTEGVRLKGEYSEKGDWEDAGTGFADLKAAYSGNDNPFSMGTARKIRCTEEGAMATWKARIPARGEYAVYVSYKTLPESTPCAHYRVSHLGGNTDFVVNQKMGGGTWIYLGTFEFDGEGWVTLYSEAPEGCNCPRNACVTADAVRFGGGMGKIARGLQDTPVSEYRTSGLPSYAEGALYWMQWAGADSTLLNLHEGDYTKDYGTRGAWVGWMSGGSDTNPDEEGLKIPVDMSFAFHTDAGVTPGDSIVGTLAIYTLKCEDSEKLPDGEGRLQSRTYADYVQTQIVDDLRKTYNPEWSRRGIWDKSYSESRTTTVPAMLLELLSHQNFGDMKYGLDPSFRFAVSRAVYKGMLKYLSARYGCDYAVQPLPVNSFATQFAKTPQAGKEARITLSWKPTEDTLEPTSEPTGYILYTRIDDGGFDSGEVLENVTSSGGRHTVGRTISPGHIYSYRIVAFNEGGRSFPSDVLSIGVPSGSNGKSVLIVDNFTRVAAPAWLDTPEIAGFDSNLDGGVAYGKETGFIGEQYEFRREMKWTDDDNPGFGASYTDKAGEVFQGNSFDNTYRHALAFMDAGCPFHSASVDAFGSVPGLSSEDFAVDIVCGKQVSTVTGRKDAAIKYRIFTEEVQKSIADFCKAGGNMIVSGSYIGTDIWSRIYPIEQDAALVEEAKKFAQDVLGYKWMTNYATRKGEVWPMSGSTLKLSSKTGKMQFHQERNNDIYNVETPDGIVPSCKDSHSILRYTDTNISAATAFDAGNYKSVCIGFPIETICRQEDIDMLIGALIEYFENPR